MRSAHAFVEGGETKKAFLFVGTWGICSLCIRQAAQLCQGAGEWEGNRKKGASSLFKDEAPKSSLAAVLAGYARDALDLRRLGGLVCADWFHLAGIERLVIAPVTLVLADVHFDHLAATFKECARLDHQ
jgi:hypothetical protein